MATQQFKRLTPEALLSIAAMESHEARDLAATPGGCEAVRFPLFVDLAAAAQAGLEAGSYACIEFILPGRPGRWRASGQISLALPDGGAGLPPGICLELLGLALTQESAIESPAEPAAAKPEGFSGGTPVKDFDPRMIEMTPQDICGILSDLLGRDVVPVSDTQLDGVLPDQALAAVYRDDEGSPRFAIVLDKPAAARIGGALTMLSSDVTDAGADGEGALTGEPLENAVEVLNIMSALFHEAGSPHIVLSEALSVAELREQGQVEVTAMLDSPSWSLAVGLQIEEYGAGEALLLAAPVS